MQLSLSTSLSSLGFIAADSSAVAGLATMTNEEGGVVAIEGNWKLGGDIVSACCTLSYIVSGLGISIMYCNMSDFNHRFIQFATILAYGTTVILVVACFSYEFLSREERHDKKYDTQVGPYRIERRWMWSTSYLCIATAAACSLLAAIAAFCSTVEALVCADDPWQGCKHCFTCSQKSHQVTPFVMPTCPSQGMHQEGTDTTEVDPNGGGRPGPGVSYVNNKSVQLPPLPGRG